MTFSTFLKLYKWYQIGQSISLEVDDEYYKSGWFMACGNFYPKNILTQKSKKTSFPKNWKPKNKENPFRLMVF